MDRRRFLADIAVLLAASLAAACRSREVANGDLDPEGSVPATRLGDLDRAIARACRYGKPLLVVVLHADPDRRDLNGLLAIALSQGTDASARRGLLEDLLLAECGCASVDELRARVPTFEAQGDPTMLVLELTPTGSLESVRSIAVPVTHAELERQLDALAAALRSALRPDDAALARLGDRNAAALRRIGELDLVDGVATRKVRPRCAIVLKGLPYLLHLVASQPGTPSATWTRGLIDDMFRMFWNTHWAPLWEQAHYPACGGMYEDDDGSTVMVSCGMPYSPTLSRRFMWYYVD